MKIAILGSGAWGSALSYVLSQNGNEVFLYTRNASTLEYNDKGVYEAFPEAKLPETVKYTDSMKEALNEAEIVVFSVPSKSYRSVAKTVNSFLDRKVHIVSTAKGFDPETKERLSSVLREEIEEKKRYPIVTLIGPSFASEVIKGLFTCLSAVSLEEEEAKFIQRVFSNEKTRVYALTDEIGAECAAALKNVLAIASGILTGMKQGENARAALVTRGIAEIKRFSMALGGKESTFLGLTGVGDLMLTCSSITSRNFALGYQIGLLDDPQKALAENKKTTEGVRSTEYALTIAKKLGVEMPIATALYDVLFSYKKPSEIVPSLMLRTLKNE